MATSDTTDVQSVKEVPDIEIVSHTDYIKILRRLHKLGPDILKLIKAAQGYQKSVSFEDISRRVNDEDLANYSFDSSAVSLLKEIGVQDYRPLHVEDDGSCLFHAASIWLCGVQTKSVELRLRTALELLTHYDHYRELPSRSAIESICPTLDETCRDCVNPDGFSSALTIQALSNVLEMDIRSLYPSLKRADQRACEVLNTTYSPTITKYKNKETLTILWCRVGLEVTKMWFPDHFVLLIPCGAFCAGISPSSSLPNPYYQDTESDGTPCTSQFDDQNVIIID